MDNITRMVMLDAKDLILRGLRTDGAHHKQWYLEQIALLLGHLLDPVRDGYDPGIAP
jgi:hypothetical protein